MSLNIWPKSDFLSTFPSSPRERTLTDIQCLHFILQLIWETLPHIASRLPISRYSVNEWQSIGMREIVGLSPVDGWGGHTASAVMTVDFIIAIGSTFHRPFTSSTTTRQSVEHRRERARREKKHRRWIFTHSIVIKIFIRWPARQRGKSGCVKANAIKLRKKNM